MDVPLIPADIKVFDPDIADDLAAAMISAVWVRAGKVAPCLKSDEFEADDTEFVKSILRDAVLRWQATGNGTVLSHSAGDYSETLNKYCGGLFRPGEIRDLQQLCAAHRKDSATTVDTSACGYREGSQTNPFLIA